ncbi:hypothetical protein FUAX_22410 [Fulvitalea axinellae]|uniref:Uncharacterized protein n=1 Tax=Fulvitalea axinellae TaxID=1182444 RepID=A0AAU9CCG5_9BACT|nr:hypothetical protein FUAX_22410 [Fulvitalea axinellae]
MVSVSLITALFYLAQIYLLCGVVFAVYFFVSGASALDEGVKNSHWSVKLIFLPGAVGLWPILLRKVLSKK